MVGADSSNLVLELVGVLDLEVLSVGGKDELVTRLNLGLLGGLPRQLVLGVQGAGEGNGARLLLLQFKLLVLSTVRVHLHDNPLGLGVDVLENVDPRVCRDLDLALCAVSAFFAIWYFSASSTFVGLGVGGGGDCDQLLVVICKGVPSTISSL